MLFMCDLSSFQATCITQVVMRMIRVKLFLKPDAPTCVVLADLPTDDQGLPVLPNAIRQTVLVLTESCFSCPSLLHALCTAWIRCVVVTPMICDAQTMAQVDSAQIEKDAAAG